MNQLEPTAAASVTVDLQLVFLPECVVTIKPGANQEQILHQLTSSLAQAGRLRWDKQSLVVEALLERERVGTTGMGKGLAFPHMRSRYVDEFVGAIGVASTGVDFKSLDGLPTRVILLLLSPFEQRQQHCEVMGRLATLLSDTTLQYSLQARRSPAAVLEFLGFRTSSIAKETSIDP